MEIQKYAKSEMVKMVDDAYSDNALAQYASHFASEYDYDSDTLDAEEAVCDAVVEGASWALSHLDDKRDELVSLRSKIDEFFKIDEPEDNPNVYELIEKFKTQIGSATQLLEQTRELLGRI